MKKSGYIVTVFAICLGFFTAIFLCVGVLSSQAVFAADNAIKIVIDAGHGGIDAGVTGAGTGIKESDLNLKIALKLSLALQDKGFETTLTRKTQEGLYDTTAKGFKRRDMAKRKEIIEQESPDLLISVHQNYYPSKLQRGAQVFYLKGDEEDERLSACLQGRLNALYQAEGVKGRKHMSAEYFILGCAPCPAALIECGFLSSERDEKLLTDDLFLEKFVSAVCSGVVEYLFFQA